MKVYANVMVQNEAIILPHVFKYWNDYPVDKWVFYDDNSTDNTVEVIKDNFGDKAQIFSSSDAEFNESKNRSTMLEFSRQSGADLALAIDADELLSANMVDKWEEVTHQKLVHFLDDATSIMYNLEKLSFDYWENLIKDTQDCGCK